jgi:hypothetical protein
MLTALHALLTQLAEKAINREAQIAYAIETCWRHRWLRVRFQLGADVGRTCLCDNHCGRENYAPRNDCMTHACLVVHEKCQENDDRQRNTEQPQQCTFSKAHGRLLICPLNVSPRHRYAFPELQDHQQDDETDRDAQQPK